MTSIALEVVSVSIGIRILHLNAACGPNVAFPSLKLREWCVVFEQIQMRDISGFVETRTTMLALKASNKSHWISFAIAHHLNGSHQLAAHALKTYADMQVALWPIQNSIKRGRC